MDDKSVWGTLSAIDCGEKIEKKGRLSYLSWAWAWERVMSAYPTASYRFDPPVFFENKTCEVWCHATIEGIERSMWLPVMDNKNLSVINPTSRDISDCRMRCLTKCLAMFGLGHYIYAGEDLPSGEVKQADISDNDKQWLKAIKADPGVLNQITDLDYKSHIQSLMGKQ